MPCNPTPCPNLKLKKKTSSNIWHLSTPCHLPPSYPGPFFCISAACDGLMHHPAGQRVFFKVWQLAGPDSSIDNKTSSSLNFTHLSFTSSNSQLLKKQRVGPDAFFECRFFLQSLYIPIFEINHPAISSNISHFSFPVSFGAWPFLRLHLHRGRTPRRPKCSRRLTLKSPLLRN